MVGCFNLHKSNKSTWVFVFVLIAVWDPLQFWIEIGYLSWQDCPQLLELLALKASKHQKIVAKHRARNDGVLMRSPSISTYIISTIFSYPSSYPSCNMMQLFLAKKTAHTRTPDRLERLNSLNTFHSTDVIQASWKASFLFCCTGLCTSLPAGDAPKL